MPTAKYTENIANDSSQRFIVDLVGANKRVLDVGCASGYLAEALTALGCTVTGVEYDEASAETARAHTVGVVVADLDRADLAEVVEGPFDVVVFGDVLEHLRDPLPTLRAGRRLLAPGGYVVISVPNVSHGDVRMSLLLGRFPYREVGLLDSTHLRFFTRDTLTELLTSAGLVAAEVRTTRRPLFDTELGVTRDEIDPVVVALLEKDPDAQAYQFVLSAVPEGATTIAAATAWELEQARRQLEDHDAGAAARADAAAHAATVRAQEAERELAALQATRTLRYRRAALKLLKKG